MQRGRGGSEAGQQQDGGAGATRQVSIVVPANRGNGGKRASIGGFFIIEEDDFSLAMGKLMGQAEVETPAIESAAASLRRSGSFRAGGAAAAAASNSKEETPYWRQGGEPDVSVYTTEKTPKAKPKKVVQVDHAIADPNPAPRAGTLAVPPPAEIMSPEGNSVANHRLEKCLLYNEVVTAQKVADHASALQDLLQIPLFLQACANVGYEPSSLHPQPMRAFKTDPITNKTRSKEEQELAHHQADIARLKHLALILTEYKDLVAKENARTRDERVAVRRASMQLIAASHAGGSRPTTTPSHVGMGGLGGTGSSLPSTRAGDRASGRGGVSDGTAAPAPPPITLSAPPAVFVSLQDMLGGGAPAAAAVVDHTDHHQGGIEYDGDEPTSSARPLVSHAAGGAAGGHDSLGTGQYTHPHSHPHSSDQQPYHPTDLAQGSMLSMPESIGQGPEHWEGEEEEGAGAGAGQGEGASGANAYPVTYPQDILAEAAAVGLDPGLVLAARQAKAAAMAQIDEVEHRTAAIVAAARASVSAGSAKAAMSGLDGDRAQPVQAGGAGSGRGSGRGGPPSGPPPPGGSTSPGRPTTKASFRLDPSAGGATGSGAPGSGRGGPGMQAASSFRGNPAQVQGQGQQTMAAGASFRVERGQGGALPVAGGEPQQGATSSGPPLVRKPSTRV